MVKNKAPAGYTLINTAIPTKYLDDLVKESGITDVRLAIQHAIVTFKKHK